MGNIQTISETDASSAEIDDLGASVAASASRTLTADQLPPGASADSGAAQEGGEAQSVRLQLIERIERERTESRLGLIYTVLLGGAACLALAGVVRHSQTTDPVSPDAPPPAVLVQTD